jgi:D-sedoheptulose 7-phosphate isomerase
MDSSELINAKLDELVNVLSNFVSVDKESIIKAALLISEAYSNGNKVLICGNGGSAADSQHLAAEFVSSFSRDIKRKALSAIALTTDTSVITAFSNDYNFDGVFARQVEAHGKPGDILIVFTTSGSSKNCINAVFQASKLSMKTIAFTKKSALISKEVDITIEVPSDDIQHIQECHLFSYHLLAEIVENSLFKKENL